MLIGIFLIINKYKQECHHYSWYAIPSNEWDNRNVACGHSNGTESIAQSRSNITKIFQSLFFFLHLQQSMAFYSRQLGWDEACAVGELKERKKVSIYLKRAIDWFTSFCLKMFICTQLSFFYSRQYVVCIIKNYYRQIPACQDA